MNHCIKAIFFAVFFFLTALSLSSVEMEGVSVTGGILIHGSTIDEAAPMPVVPQIGLAMPVRFLPFFSLRPSLSFYSLYFGYSEGYSQPVPIEKERREVMVFNLLLDIPLVFGWKIIPELELGGFITPSFLFRIPAIAYDGKDQLKDSMTDYFYGEGRFFMPGGGIYTDWHISESFSAGLKIQALVPVHQLYAESGGTLFDEMVISANLVATLHLGQYQFRKVEDRSADEILSDVEKETGSNGSVEADSSQ